MSFDALGLSEPLVQAVSDLSFAAPTAVQAASIPAILAGRDLWASAQTGSGKTAAFLLPVLQRLSTSRGAVGAVRALVVVPTRELAAQIGEAARLLSRHLPVETRIRTVVGGVSINPQMMALRGGAELVVATPGRLLDLVHRNALRLGDVETLVLDEADRMFSLGFADELAAVMQRVPSGCQRLFFSATLPLPVQALAEAVLRDPVRVEVDAPASSGITQRVIEVDADRRTALLRHLLQTEGWKRALVFVESAHRAEHVARKLAGQLAAALHGDLSQGARTAALADLHTGRLRVLIATDLAARGLDIAGLPVVINYDLPRSTLDYLHRIGRTGRAGEAGVAVSFVSAETDAHFRLVEQRHQLALPREQIAGFEPKDLAPPVRDTLGGVKGKRRSKKDKLRAVGAEAPDLDGLLDG